MKTFLINLDQHEERLVNSSRQLSALGVEFERISAVYGKNLTSAEKRAATNRFGWWCAQGGAPRDGQIGCALSHIRIYQRMIRENIPYLCILEDDNRYKPNFKEVVDRAEKLLDVSEPQVLLLSNCWFDRPNSPEIHLQPAKIDQWTSSYIITMPAAKRILEANFPIKVPCDYWRRWVQWNVIKLYHVFPTVAEQDVDAFQSDIEAIGTQRVANMAPCQYLLHKFNRLIGKAIDNLFLALGVWR